MLESKELSILDEAVDFCDAPIIATSGLHAGIITDVVSVEKGYITERPQKWLAIVVSLIDQNDIHGDPIKVRVEMTMTSKAHGSHLRNILFRLGFKPARDDKFRFRRLCGLEVDVFVTCEPGKNRNYKFAKVRPDDLNLRGKGKNKIVATEIDDIKIERGII